MESFNYTVRNPHLVLTGIWSLGLGELYCSPDWQLRSLILFQAPMFGDYIEAFDSNLTDVVQFTGVAILVLGFSNFIW